MDSPSCGNDGKNHCNHVESFPANLSQLKSPPILYTESNTKKPSAKLAEGESRSTKIPRLKTQALPKLGILTEPTIG